MYNKSKLFLVYLNKEKISFCLKLPYKKLVASLIFKWLYVLIGIFEILNE